MADTRQRSHGKGEIVRHAMVDALGGVEVMHARFVRQSFSRHFHERYALGCIESGAMEFRYRGENVVAGAGEVNLVVPGECHDGHAAHESGWAYRMFYLPVRALREAAEAVLPCVARGDEGLPFFRPGVIDDPALAACVRATHACAMNPDAPLLEKETRVFWLLANWISRHADEHGSLERALNMHRDRGRAGLAREYLDANLAEDLSLEQLAGVCGISRFQVVRIFQREFGITPHAYLIQTRVRRARDLLRGSRLRLADVAAETGFCDQAHLTRLFKRQLGITPGHWRNYLQNS